MAEFFRPAGKTQYVTRLRRRGSAVRVSEESARAGGAEIIGTVRARDADFLRIHREVETVRVFDALPRHARVVVLPLRVLHRHVRVRDVSRRAIRGDGHAVEAADLRTECFASAGWPGGDDADDDGGEHLDEPRARRGGKRRAEARRDGFRAWCFHVFVCSGGYLRGLFFLCASCCHPADRSRPGGLEAAVYGVSMW